MTPTSRMARHIGGWLSGLAFLASMAGMLFTVTIPPEFSQAFAQQPTLVSLQKNEAAIPPPLRDLTTDPTTTAALPSTRPVESLWVERLGTLRHSKGSTQHSALPKLDTSFGRLPLQFEENQGQTDEQVKFLARGRGYTLFLTPTEAVLALRKAEAKVEAQEGLEGYRGKGVSSNKAEIGGEPSPPRGEGQGEGALTSNIEPRTQNSVIRMRLEGANAQPSITGTDKLPGIVNYFIGNDPKKWRTHIPTYKKVEYKDVYPGIDLIYYGNHGKLEYDLVVTPGSDPDQVKVSFQGHEGLLISEQGNLLLKVAGGEVVLLKPHVYQTIKGKKIEIAASYVLQPFSPPPLLSAETVSGASLSPKSFVLLTQSVGIQVAAYDVTKSLTIDPALAFATYLGGSGTDFEAVQGGGLAVDALGNVYVSGQTGSTDFPTANAFQPTFGGGPHDAFVAKLSATGSALVYSTFLGGNDSDAAADIAVDSVGNAYITGGTASANFPTANAFQPTFGGGPQDAFVAKLSPDGSALVYSTYLGGSGNDISGLGAIAVDGTGNAFVTGGAGSDDFPTANAFQPTRAGGLDAFVAKFNAAGSNLVYSTYLGGSLNDSPYDIAVDATGAAYVTGQTGSSNFPTSNTFDDTLGGTNDAFVTKLNPAGSTLAYSTYLGGTGDEVFGGVAGITVDTAGNAYVASSTASTDFPTANAFQPTFGGGSHDAFVVKLNAAGSAPVYSTYLGGTLQDRGTTVAIDGAGNAYVSGFTGSSDFPTLNPLQATLNGTFDAFVTKLNAAGSALVYSTYLGGSGAEPAFGIKVDAVGDAWLLGQTTSTDFPIKNALQETFGGGPSDIYVAKIVNSGTPVAWGGNLFGQLGDGTTADRGMPGAVLELIDIIAVASGLGHSLALLGDSTVRAWGRNTFGALGDGTTSHRSTPVTVTGLSNVVAIAPGGLHSLALLADGTVQAWGSNGSGQLGDGTTSHRSTPVTVTGLSNVVAIAAGASHSLALLADGTVRAWGFNANGELGDGVCDPTFPSNCVNSSTPIQVSGLSNVVAIESLGSSNFAFLNDGTIRAWGGNVFGKLGDGTTVNRSSPVPVTSFTNPVAIGGGSFHTLALLEDGTVEAIGNNSLGQLGDGTTTSSTTPVVVSGLSNVTALAVINGNHSLALLADGTVQAWGGNASGQLGDGTTSNRSTPGPVIGLTDVFAIAGGGDFSLALTTGPVADAQSVTTDEDTAVSITLTGSDPDGDSLTFTVTGGPSHGFLTSSPPNVTYTPDPDFNVNIGGTDSFTFKVNDGTADSADATVTITVNAVNDPPVFTAISNQTINEGAGSQNVTILGIAPGPPTATDETGQPVTLTALSGDPAIIVDPPTVSAVAGGQATLTYSLVDTDINTAAGGPVTIFVTADDGQSVNNISSQSFTVTVTPVNDPPSFLAGPSQVVLEDAGLQTVVGWATALSTGPANESGQTLAFVISGNDNPGLFVVLPAVSPTGTLIYQSAPNAYGVANLQVIAQDDGGTANGGADTSPTQTFSITVQPVNDAPVLTITDQTVQEGQPVSFTVTASDVEGDPLSFAANVLPPGASFDPATRAVTWTPQPNQAGFQDQDKVYHPVDGFYPAQFTVTETNTSPPSSDTRSMVFTVEDTIQDTDSDNVRDIAELPEFPADNCPTVYNPDQADTDGDGTGNLCDPEPIGTPFVGKVTVSPELSPPAGGGATHAFGEEIFLTVRTAFARVDHIPDGVADAYYAFRPDDGSILVKVERITARDPITGEITEKELVIQNRIIEIRALHIPGDLIKIPGGTEPCPIGTTQVSDSSCEVTTVLELSQHFTSVQEGEYVVTPVVVNFNEDFEFSIPECDSEDEGCFAPIWIGIAPGPPTTVEVVGTTPIPTITAQMTVTPTDWDLTWDEFGGTQPVDLFLGNFSNGVTAADIIAPSLILNGNLFPPSLVEVVTGIPGFAGDVLHLQYPRAEAIRSVRTKTAVNNFLIGESIVIDLRGGATTTTLGTARFAATAVVTIHWAAEQIRDLVAFVASLNLQQGIENSLDAKLENADKALIAQRDGSTETACNLMAAFDSEVEAQREKKITGAQADELRTRSGQIQTAMGCP